MKPVHLMIVAMVVVGVLYVLTLAVGARTHDRQGPSTDEERRSFDASDSFAWIGTLQGWFSREVELEQDAFVLGAGERREVTLPPADARYRRLELEVTEPAVLEDASTVSLTYRPRSRGGEDYPEELTEPARWPEGDGDLPDVTFLILNGGGTLLLENEGLSRLRVEAR